MRNTINITKAVALAIAALALVLGVAEQAKAGFQGFVNSPTTNSTDFRTYVAGQGATVNSDVNFDTHPVGPLQPNFYLGSDGVTLTTTGAFGGVTFGAGPGQGNTFTPPLSPGEGPHPASNFLLDNAGPSTLTISFNSPVEGVGLFMIDYFGPEGPSSTITAFSGQNGTGANLGTFSSVQENFQPNNLYFLGIADNSGNSIGSLVYSYDGSLTGDVTGIDDILFARNGVSAVPEPASLTLLGVGFAGLMGYVGVRRRKKAAQAA